jgi:hypothetical protein
MSLLEEKMQTNRTTRTIILAILAAIVFGAFGASSSQTVSAQDNSWQIYRVESSPDGTLYIEYRSGGLSQLYREDGVGLLLSGSNFSWSAVSQIVVTTNTDIISFYRFADLLNRDVCCVIPSLTSLSGSYNVWEEPFQNGDFLVLNRETQQWQQVAVDVESGLYRRNMIGDEDLYPIGIVGDELGYMLGENVMIYDATTQESSISPKSWPIFREDTIQVSGLAGQPNYTITHYQVVVETNRWQFITGLVNGLLEAGVYYTAGTEYWLGAGIDPMSASRLVTVRGNNLILANEDAVFECQVEAYGVQCDELPIPLE